MQVMNVQGLGTRLMAGHVCAFQCMLSLVVLASFSDNCFLVKIQGEREEGRGRGGKAKGKIMFHQGGDNYLVNQTDCSVSSSLSQTGRCIPVTSFYSFCHKTGGLGTSHTEYSDMYQLYCRLCPNHSTLFGASLSEPHIDGTTGRFHICIMV